MHGLIAALTCGLLTACAGRHLDVVTHPVNCASPGERPQPNLLDCGESVIIGWDKTNRAVRYPPVRQGFGVSGFAMATLRISPSGVVDSIIEGPMSDSQFRLGFMLAARAWRFRPYQLEQAGPRSGVRYLPVQVIFDVVGCPRNGYPAPMTAHPRQWGLLLEVIGCKMEVSRNITPFSTPPPAH